MKWPWKISFVLLLVGLLVVFFSLQSMQSKAVAQDFASPEDSPQHPTCFWHQWLDAKLPGSAPYQVQRVFDKLELMTKRGPNKSLEQLKLAQHRFEASQYAWEHDHRAQAIQTLHKSVMYLSQSALEAAGAASKTAVANSMDEVMEKWSKTDVSEHERAQLNKLQSQLEAIRQHHHF